MNASISSRHMTAWLLLAAITLLVGACTGLPVPGGQVGSPTPTSAPQPTGIIAGRIWRDLCAGGAGCVQTEDGSFRPDGVEAPDEPGIEGLTVDLGLGTCPSTGLATAQTGPNGAYLFSDLPADTYCISVDPGTADNASRLGPTNWTHPSYGPGVSRITVTLRGENETRLVSFGRAGEVQEPTATPLVPTPTGTPAPIACTNRATFLLDVTIPDDTQIKAGSAFDKTWRLRNDGTCPWTTDYDLVFVSGDRLGGPSSKTLPRTVAPGEIVELTARLSAPKETGLYQGYWMLMDANNKLFGVGASANGPFWVRIVVGSLGTTTNGAWRGEYFARRDLKGTAGAVRNDPVIDFNWGEGAPISGLPKNDFSVRWTGKSLFESGTYRFTVLVDDGARLYVDDQLVIDAWKDGSRREVSADIGLTRASHSIRLEYYEHTGAARIRLTWVKVNSPTFDDWKGEYWANRELKGSPALVRNDDGVDFNWKTGSPAVGLPSDDFSARWTRTVELDGRYRLNAYADDGVRVYVNGKLVIDEWHGSSGSETYVAEIEGHGSTTLKVEYYEHGGAARVHFGWTKVQPTATPTATATATGTQPPTTEPPTPTATPTATTEPTATPSPTPTNTVVPTAAPAVVLDFVDRACDASWSNEGSTLPCPGTPGSADGAVYTVDHPVTETGSASAEDGLVTEPEQSPVGVIVGTFPSVSIQAGDRFSAYIGCMNENPSCSVIFELEAKVGSNTTSLGSWTETADGTLRATELDLSSYAGQEVVFVLSVQANTSGAQNRAVWVGPAVLR